MNNFIISLLVLLIFLFHLYINRHIRLSKVKEGLCALWCMDAIFAICGTVLNFAVYRYNFASFFTLRNIILILVYLILTFLFLLLSPSGLDLLVPKKSLSAEELLIAEYRYNDTLCMVRRFFLMLLFFLPIIFAFPIKEEHFLSFLTIWESTDVFGGFYFTIFLLLLPLSLRQALYWMKSLRSSPTPEEIILLHKYSMSVHYHRRNLFL